MIFTKTNVNKLPLASFKVETLSAARYYILVYLMKASEQALDQYCIEKYKKPLKTICLQLLANSTFMQDRQGNVSIIFKNPKDDDLASLICYGNELVQGSKILRHALGD